MEKHLPVELADVQIENDTLLMWLHELIEAGKHDFAKEWVKCFDKICRHFPCVKEDYFEQYILNNFPIESILTGLWSESTANLSLFFANTIRIYDENFHIEFVSRYPDVAYTLKRLPVIMETMPALNSMLILVS